MYWDWVRSARLEAERNGWTDGGGRTLDYEWSFVAEESYWFARGYGQGIDGQVEVVGRLVELRRKNLARK